jgi:hypothetical protein
MPIIDLGKWPDKTEVLAYHLLLATMAFPDDEVKRKQYIAVKILCSKTVDIIFELKTSLKENYSDYKKKLLEQIENLEESRMQKVKDQIQSMYESVDGEKTILNSPSYEEVMNEFARTLREGLVVGQLLVLMKQMSEHEEIDKVSKRRAIELLVKLLAEPLKKSGWKAVNRDSFEKLWIKFRTVSHLFAALHLLALNDFPAELDPENDQGFIGFLNVAEQFQQFVTSFIPSGPTKSPLVLNDEIWRLPKNLPYKSMKTSLHPLPKEQLEILKAYQAPQ